MSDLNKFHKTPYLEEMRERVTFAFKNSRVFDKYLRLFNVEVEELQEALRQLMQDRSIDTAKGVQLDIIGDIVGQPRELVDSDLIPFFGFEGALEARSYGDLNDRSVGGFYWDINSPTTGNVLLNDDQYRIFIRAKIIKNFTRATPEDVINFIKFVFGAEIVQIATDEGARQALILVSDDLNTFEIALLRYFVEGEYKSYFVPKSLGVGYEFGTVPQEDFFSFSEVEGGLGYGTYDPLTDETIGGGKYASIYM